MIVHKDLEDFKVDKPVLTIGTFDGVHKGHHRILDQLKLAAKEINGETVVFTFWPHPRMVVNPFDDSLRLLNTINEKIALLEKAGIDHLIIHPFTPEFSKLSSCDFIEQILYKQIGIKCLVVGHDHRFGHDRQGDIEVLRQCAKPFGFDIKKVEVLSFDGVDISSTKIRKALDAGEIEKAKYYLGYDYPLTGKVIHGEKIGRDLGFPTANLKLWKHYKLVPAFGVYATEVIIDNQKYTGMLSIGVRPTINDENMLSIEVNIFDFDENIYDQEITILPKKYIRGELKLNTLQELIDHMKNDKKQVLAWFKQDS